VIPTAASAKAEVTEFTGTQSAAGISAFLSYRVSEPTIHYSHESYYDDVTDDWRTTGAATVLTNFTEPISDSQR